MNTSGSSENESPHVGAVIADKYRIDRVLGEGGMGIVLEATHTALGQKVAVKVLRADVARSPENVTRFLREAQIAAQLPPEHIARVTDVGQTERGEPFLVMELLTGHDLAAELAKRGPLPIEEAVGYILQACEGVAEAHAAGLVHRDLKPANLFIATRRSGAPTIKVLDFGLSKSYDPADQKLTQTSSSFGTPAYMAPEQIRSAKYAEARSDQHAIAMILFELLTGRMPYTAKNVTGLLVVIATEPPPSARKLRPDVPEALDAVIRRAMGKSPDNRYPDLGAFAAALAPFGGQGSGEIAQRTSDIIEPKRVSGGRMTPRPSASPEAANKKPRPGPHLDTHAPAISDGLPSHSRRRKPLIAVALASVATIAALIVVVAVAFHGGAEDPASAGEGAPSSQEQQRAAAPIEVAAAAIAATQAQAPASPPAAESSAAPVASAAPAPTIAKTAAAPRPAVGTAGSRGKTAPKTGTTSPHHGKTAREVFGGDR